MSLDIYAEQYVEEYCKLKKQYPYLDLTTIMLWAKQTTNEYLYLKLREELKVKLKVKPVWPGGFVP